jgi:thiamine monophosphate synthase
MESRLDDREMQAVPRALLRAARRAREIARETGTPLIIERDGVIVEENINDDDHDG